jgi:CDP-glucose 4,6-dehydratase
MGYLTLAEALWHAPDGHSCAWNFGPSDADTRTVGWVVTRIAELWGDGARWQAAPDASMHEARSLRLDISKARVALGWAPRLPLTAALEWVVEWYKAYARGAEMRQLTLEMIERFEALPANSAVG